MVRIRMQRLGRTHRPFYRIGAADARRPRSGVFIEQLGWYDPIAKDASKQVKLNAERIQYWLAQGAQPTDTVRDLLGRMDLLPEKMKAQWEADRELARKRIEAKVHLKAAQEVLAGFEKLDAGEIDPKPYEKRVRAAVKDALRAVGKGRIEAAQAAREQAETAWKELNDEIAKSKEEPASQEGEQD